MCVCACRQTHRQIDRQTQTQIQRERDRQTERQRQRDRQRRKETETDRQTKTETESVRENRIALMPKFVYLYIYSKCCFKINLKYACIDICINIMN